MADLPNVNAEEIGVFNAIAGSSDDGPVLMLNLNRCVEEANFPDGELYREYMTVLDQLLIEVGGRIFVAYKGAGYSCRNAKHSRGFRDLVPNSLGITRSYNRTIFSPKYGVAKQNSCTCRSA